MASETRASPSTAIEFRVLGPLEVARENRPVKLGGGKQRALLTLLLLRANEPVAAERLVDELWGERPPGTAQTALHGYVSQLRRLLGRERIVTRAPGYALSVQPGELDLERFSTLVEAARKQEPAKAAETLREALSLWRGEPLADLAYEPFAQAEAGRLEELRLAALEARIDAELALGRHEQLVAELESLVAAHPLRERLRAQLMLALYRSGRQAEALERYQDARQALTEELGIEPTRELRDLQQAILNQDPTLDRAAEETSTAEPARGAFVGRERELDELVAGMQDAFAGHGRLFLLVGEPGIGKSRLADELIARARARSACVLVGRCWEAGGAPAYWPWVQALRAYVRETQPAALESQLGVGAPDLAQLLPELREWFPDLPEPPPLESESARFRLFEAASSFLRNASQARPLVLVVDDLHAADEPSLLLLRFLARELGDSRLLVVGACRNVDPIPTDPLRTALTELAREPITRTLALSGLGEGEVARYIQLTSGEPPADELVAAIHEETEGNPLFVGEIVRLLATEGGLDASQAPQLPIPQSIRDVITRRLRHLSDECNRVLLLASVLGREFDLDALAHLAELSHERLLDVLDEAMAAGVVTDLQGSPGQLRFAHVLIRDTLYEGLTTARRVRLHRMAVETLEGLYGEEPGPHLAELAHHAIAGSDFEKGLRYARLAGDRALELLAYEEAARLYIMALDALDLADPNNERARCQLLLSLGDAESAGDRLAAKRTFLEAAEIARVLGLGGELARAAAGYGGRNPWMRAGDDDRLVPLLEEGLAAVADDDVELRARLLARLAGALRGERSRERRDRLSEEAVGLARRTGNPGALAYALEGRGGAIVAPDTVAELLAVAREQVEAAERVGDRERIAHGHFWRLIGHVIVGDIREADADLDAQTRISEELRQPVQLHWACAARTMLALAAGRIDEAEKLVPHALALGEGADPEMAIPVERLHRYTLCEFRGGLEELEPGIAELVAEQPDRPVFHGVLAHLHANLGRMEDARRELRDLAAEDFSALNFDLEWLLGMSLLAETSALLADAESAAVLYRLLAPWGHLNVADAPEAIRGSVARYLGLLAAKLERWDEAERHFEDALAMNERMGARPWLAYTQHDYAQMLLTRGDAGGRDRARRLREQAQATYRELGMQPRDAGSAA